MAEVIKLNDLRGGYIDLVKFVREQGQPAAPRGQEVRELLGVTVQVADPIATLPWDVGRKMNPSIFAAEAASLIGGLSDLEQMRSVSHVFGNFANGDRLLGAYGPRTASQIPLVLQRICADPDTRQAVATIWNSLELLDQDNKDMPCTVALTFNLRAGRLNMHTFMRSNDVWLGTTYDYGQFTRLQICIAWALGVELGDYTHTAANLHLYERDIERSLALTHPETDELPADYPFAPVERDWEPSKAPLPYEEVERRWYRVREWMERAVAGSEMPSDAPPDAVWFADRLKKHASGNTLNMVSRYMLPDVN